MIPVPARPEIWLPGLVDVEGMFLHGLGLPSQLEHEDYATLWAAQVRMAKAREDAELARWQNEVRRSYG